MRNKDKKEKMATKFIKEPKKELVEEHERLVKKLKQTKFKKEAREQEKELEEYKKK